MRRSRPLSKFTWTKITDMNMTRMATMQASVISTSTIIPKATLGITALSCI
nr:hypothetical protein [Hyphomonas sp. 34-62-18]